MAKKVFADEEKDFKELKAYWYQKLKEAGFEDAETENGFLKDWPSQRLKRDYSPERFEEKQDYYRLASQFYHEHLFECSHEKRVWELHSLGFSLREIVFKLRDRTNKVNKDNIQKITSKYSKIIRGMLLEESHEEE